MVHVKQINNVNNVTPASLQTSDHISVASVGTNGSALIESNITTDNVVDIGNLYSGGQGINISYRTISVDTTVVALKSDLTGFLTSHQDISGKADKATTLNGYGILDGITYEEVEDDEEE